MFDPTVVVTFVVSYQIGIGFAYLFDQMEINSSIHLHKNNVALCDLTLHWGNLAYWPDSIFPVMEPPVGRNLTVSPY